jgi:hypothetical protein
VVQQHDRPTEDTMTTPSDPDNGNSAEGGVNLGKDDQPAEEPFDPYRFGKPDHPIPAEYAPPGYTGPVTPSAPYQQPQVPWHPGGQPPPQSNPFSNPPGVPYGPGQQPYQYPPTQYGPPPPPYHAYVQPKAGNGKAIAGLVLGIASIVFCFLFFLDGVLVILGLVFSLIAMSETKAPGARGRGMAVAGLVCSLVGAALATLLTVLLVHAANQCGGLTNSDQPNWETCVSDNFGG